MISRNVLSIPIISNQNSSMSSNIISEAPFFHSENAWILLKSKITKINFVRSTTRNFHNFVEKLIKFRINCMVSTIARKTHASRRLVFPLFPFGFSCASPRHIHEIHFVLLSRYLFLGHVIESYTCVCLCWLGAFTLFELLML